MKKIAIIIPIIIVVLVFFTSLSFFIQTGSNSRSVTIEIKQGSSSNDIADILREKGIIKSRFGFKLATKALFLHNKLQAGFYEFKPHQMLISVIRTLSNGKTKSSLLRITFPEGTSIYKMGSILERHKISYFEDFRKLAENINISNYLSKYTFSTEVKTKSLEGFLFPDTYIIEPNTSKEVLISMMLNQFDSIIWPFWLQNKKDASLSFYETLILASIIEKEAKLDSERAIISSVFYNRLNIKMPLAADPTIKYALENPTKHVFLRQLKTQSPYNTYKRRGLPPTPICNPGLASFKAAIYPEKTDYLYFVAQKDGSHLFSKSWDQHQRARIKSMNAIPTR